MHAVADDGPVWDDGSWTPLPPLGADASADACVVGLGGSGLACVRELRAMGASVIGLDARDVGAGAAGRNGGFLLAGLAPFHHEAVGRWGRARAVRLYEATLAELDHIFATLPGIARRTGSLRLALSEDEVADCERQLAVMREDALPAEWYEGPEGVGLLIPSDGVFNPLARCRVRARQARDEGATLHGDSPAIALEPGLVRTARGAVRCGAVIAAVDGRLERLFPELAPRVRTARLQMLATAPTEEVRLTRPVYARHGYEYWQQLPDGRIALGGFRDVGAEGEWTDSVEPSAVVQASLERFLREHVGVRAAVTHRWAASVSYSADALPIMEEVRRGVWACGAYSGTGNVVGAICGRAVAHLALEGRSVIGALFAER